MRKNIVYPLFLGLVGIFLVSCEPNNASGPIEIVQRGLFSETYPSMENEMIEPIVHYSTIFADNTGQTDGTVSYETVAGPDDGVHPVDGNSMYKIDFQQAVYGGIKFEVNTRASSVDMRKFRHGSLVFSINYEGLDPDPTRFYAVLTSGTATNRVSATIEFLDEEDNVGARGFTDYISESDGDWHTVRIPLFEFKLATPDLDLADITEYLNIHSPGERRDGQNAPAPIPWASRGIVYLDNIYFDSTPVEDPWYIWYSSVILNDPPRLQ